MKHNIIVDNEKVGELHIPNNMHDKIDAIDHRGYEVYSGNLYGEALWSLLDENTSPGEIYIEEEK
jgi:hypothetical protein